MEALFTQYSAIIDMMPTEFDSHQFILRLAEHNQVAYIQALSRYLNNGAPFQTLHAQLSGGLNELTNLVEHIGVVQSNNIFGNQSPCAKWRKLNQPSE